MYIHNFIIYIQSNYNIRSSKPMKMIDFWYFVFIITKSHEISKISNSILVKLLIRSYETFISFRRIASILYELRTTYLSIYLKIY